MSHPGEGRLQYGPGIRAVLLVDQSIANYYRHMIPKYVEVKPQRHQAHVTVVRIGLEVPTNMESWGRHEGELIRFRYGSDVLFDNGYYYLNVECPRIEQIRLELGLPPVFDVKKGHHITIGNSK